MKGFVALNFTTATETMMKRGVSTSMKQCENKSLGNPGPIEVITLSSGDEGTDSRSARSHSYRRRRSVTTDRQRNSPAHRHYRSVSRERKRKIRTPSGSGSKSSSWSKSRRSVTTDRQRNSPAHRHYRSVRRERKRKIRTPSGSGSKSSSWAKSRRSVTTDRQRNSPAHRHYRSVSRERKRKIRTPSGSGSKSSSWAKSRRSVTTDRQRNSPAHRHYRSVSRERKRKIRTPSGSGSKSSSWAKSRRSVTTDRQRNSPAHRHYRSVSRERKRKIRTPSGSGSKSSSWAKSRRSVTTDRQRNSPAHRHYRSVSRERKRKIRTPSGSGSKSSSWAKSRRSVTTDRQRNSPAHRHYRSVSRERKRKIRTPSGSGSKSSSWAKSRRSVTTDRQRNSPAHRHYRSVSRERKRKIRTPSGSGSKSSSWAKSRSFGKRPYNTFHSRRNPRKASLSPVAENDYADTQVSSIYGRNIPFPITDFSQGHFKECIFETLKTLNYQKPTPIQAQGIPAILKGRDVVGIAQTGSGKTLTYILPAIVHVDQKCGYQKRNDGPTVLILAPTRELAQQIQSVCGKFTRRMNIKNICITGGEKKKPQLQNLDGADICIATPGRLIDFLQSSDIILKNSTTLVIIDEADRLLDMGFMPQIIKILKQLKPDHQTLMFSATWPTDVKQIAEDFLQDYIQINIGTLKLAANHNITQIVDVVEECEKDDKLIELLKKLKNKSEKKIVFSNRRDRVEELTYHLKNNGYDAEGIHGKKSQKVRDQVLSEFRKGCFPILVATDVAARGLDVDDIKYVINVDFPNCSEDYIHRIGRTARLNKTGTAYTFFTIENINHAKFLVDVLEEANQTVNPKLLDLVEMPQSFNFRRGSPL